MSETPLNFKNVLKNAFRKIVGWTSIIFSVFFFIASLTLLVQGDFGPFVTGLMFSLFLLVSGWAIQTSIEELRKRIVALMKRHFPQCPICKSDEGYKIRGLLPSSQYVKCKTCGAEWTSRDFVGYKDLRALKLWKPPKNPEIYAEFISESALKPKKTYPTKLWQALMNKEEIQLPSKTSRISLADFVASHTNGVILVLVSLTLILVGFFSFTLNYSIGCFAISAGTSMLLTLVGFYSVPLSKEKAYVLFWTAFFAVFFGLMTVFS